MESLSTLGFFLEGAAQISERISERWAGRLQRDEERISPRILCHAP